MKWQSLARYHFIFFKAMVRACSGVSTLSHIILFCSCSPLETERKQLLEKEKKYFYPSFLVTCRNSGRVLTDHFNFYLSIYIFFFYKFIISILFLAQNEKLWRLWKPLTYLCIPGRNHWLCYLNILFHILPNTFGLFEFECLFLFGIPKIEMT